MLSDLAVSGVGDAMATVVALHHSGSGASQLGGMLNPLLDGLPATRLVLPQAEQPRGNGYTWFHADYYSDPLVQAETLARVADGLAERLKEYAPFIVTGVSQGADLSLALALRHPNLVIAALPMLGMLPDELIPADAKGVLPPLYLFHGEDDAQVSIGRARRTGQALTDHSASVTLHVYPGVSHALPEALMLDWKTDLAALLDRSRYPE
jgi:phospholipase/carboxylesterase